MDRGRRRSKDIETLLEKLFRIDRCRRLGRWFFGSNEDGRLWNWTSRFASRGGEYHFVPFHFLFISFHSVGLSPAYTCVHHLTLSRPNIPFPETFCHLVFFPPRIYEDRWKQMLTARRCRDSQVRLYWFSPTNRISTGQCHWKRYEM